MSLLARLLHASRWGAALALTTGCGGNIESNASTDPGDASTDAPDAADGPGDASPADANGEAGLPTTPYPEPAGCSGPEFDGGYYGQCCEKVGCAEPVNGACPDPSQVNHNYLPSFPVGSGSCTCGDPVRGPFAPREPSEGACCYVFGTIACEGRPLIVEGSPRLPPLVSRSDWGARLDARA